MTMHDRSDFVRLYARAHRSGNYISIMLFIFEKRSWKELIASKAFIDR